MNDEQKIAEINDLIFDHMNEGDISPSITLARILEVAQPLTCREGEHPFGDHGHPYPSTSRYDVTTARRLV